MKDILVLGMGKVGSLVGVLLSKKFKVKAIDKKRPHYKYNLPFECIEGDVSNLEFIKEELKNHDAVVSALPYYLNKDIAQIAHDLEVHYFDLTEDVAVSRHIRKISEGADTVFMPQCGLAPRCGPCPKCSMTMRA